MIDRYVLDAASAHIRGLAEGAALRYRPVRIDGFTAEEIASLLDDFVAIAAPARVGVLATVTSEDGHAVNAERATRYRNEVDAGKRPGFVLLVPHGVNPESSLRAPAFNVITRDDVFAAALERRRRELDLTKADIEAFREA